MVVSYNIQLKICQRDTNANKKRVNSHLSPKKWNRPTLVHLAEDLTMLRSYLLSKADKCHRVLNDKLDNIK